MSDILKIGDSITICDLAEALDVGSVDINDDLEGRGLPRLLYLGALIDFDTAQAIAHERGFKVLYESSSKTFTETSRQAGPGYHLTEIPVGTYGQVSKIVEEALEVQDADKQGVRVMVLVELADLIGAIKGYLNEHEPGMTLGDLEAMADVTHRAFENGKRKAKTS